MSSTNEIESVHYRISEWTKGTVTRWRDYESGMRSRFFVLALACAESKWKNVPARREALERMTLAILCARHPDVELDVAAPRRGLTLSGVRFEPEGRPEAQEALVELIRWADRNGKPIALGADALVQPEIDESLRTWLEEQGFVADARSDQTGELIRLPRVQASREASAVRRAGGERERAPASPDPVAGGPVLVANTAVREASRTRARQAAIRSRCCAG